MDTFAKAFYDNEKTREEQSRRAAELTQVPSLPTTMAEFETLTAEQAAKRAYDIRQKDAEQYAADVKRWNTIELSIKQHQSYVDAAREVVERWERALKGAQSQSNEMLANGFVPPATVVELPKPKVVAQASKVAPVMEEEKIPTRKEINCPNCGNQILEGIAFHSIGNDMICILDERRARLSGVPKERIADTLERQRLAKENQ